MQWFERELSEQLWSLHPALNQLIFRNYCSGRNDPAPIVCSVPNIKFPRLLDPSNTCFILKFFERSFMMTFDGFHSFNLSTVQIAQVMNCTHSHHTSCKQAIDCRTKLHTWPEFLHGMSQKCNNIIKNLIPFSLLVLHTSKCVLT